MCISDDPNNSEIMMQMSNMYTAVQGNFHQANDIFGLNAGLQCVPNCLSALSYHKLKEAQLWQPPDLDRILTTGNELYDTLQRYTNFGHRYLLISDLPRILDIHSKLFSMSFAESVASLITTSEVEALPDLSLFNAKP